MTSCQLVRPHIKTPHQESILTEDAKVFLVGLHRTFNIKRKELLLLRQKKQEELIRGEKPKFITEATQDPHWKVAKVPKDLQRRWVEITGPTDAKMVINALNSQADVFMADFEDANSPTWENMIEGQHNLREAIHGTLVFKSPDGKEYALNEKRATLMVRPRGWHLEEAHFHVDGEPMSASLFDFGLFFFHNAKTLLSKDSGPYFYLAKLENHLEARLWNAVFLHAETVLAIPKGSIRATVLLETILAAFEMEQILFELKDYSAGLNAGRWDYIFSAIKKFQADKDFKFPDRSQITMTVPFLHNYCKLLVYSCKKRAATPIGGMAAFIPSRRDAELNATALTKVREDKQREVSLGFEGTWVAHPDLVPVARKVFEANFEASKDPSKVSEGSRASDSSSVNAADLIDFTIKSGEITEDGLRKNISIALQYLQAWLGGTGAVGIYNLMEDMATAEISRAQLWQWVHHKATIHTNGKRLTKEYYLTVADDEFTKLTFAYASDPLIEKRLLIARTLLDQSVLTDTFTDFISLKAYQELLNLGK